MQSTKQYCSTAVVEGAKSKTHKGLKPENKLIKLFKFQYDTDI